MNCINVKGSNRAGGEEGVITENVRYLSDIEHLDRSLLSRENNCDKKKKKECYQIDTLITHLRELSREYL